MARVGAVEVEKIGLTTPKERLLELAATINAAHEMEMASQEWMKARSGRVHPSHVRWDKYAALSERFASGEVVTRRINHEVAIIEADPGKGKYAHIVGAWYLFACEHPETVSPERTKTVWLAAIKEEKEPIFRMQHYCSYVQATKDRNDLLLSYFETDVLKLLAVDGVDGTTLEFLLRMMSAMRGAGVSTEKFEAYFEFLVDNVDASQVEGWFCTELFDYLKIYHRKEVRRVSAYILENTQKIAPRLEVDERGKFVSRVAEILADLDLYDTTEKLWLDSLQWVRFPSSEGPSSLIGCAIRTGNTDRLSALRGWHRQISAQRELADGFSDKARTLKHVDEDVEHEWEHGWLLALLIHIDDEQQARYLESAIFLESLARGIYDHFLDDLTMFCEAHPQLLKLRQAVKRRFEVGFVKLNSGKMEDDELVAMSLMRAAVEFQKLPV